VHRTLLVEIVQNQMRAYSVGRMLIVAVVSGHKTTAMHLLSTETFTI
jgi:hypothetical protein